MSPIAGSGSPPAWARRCCCCCFAQLRCVFEFPILILAIVQWHGLSAGVRLATVAASGGQTGMPSARSLERLLPTHHHHLHLALLQVHTHIDALHTHARLRYTLFFFLIYSTSIPTYRPNFCAAVRNQSTGAPTLGSASVLLVPSRTALTHRHSSLAGPLADSSSLTVLVPADLTLWPSASPGQVHTGQTDTSQPPVPGTQRRLTQAPIRIHTPIPTPS